MPHAPAPQTLKLPARELMALLVDSTGGINTLRDLRAYAVFSAQAVQLIGRGLGFAVRAALFDGAGDDTHIEVMLDNETAAADKTLPPELSMLLSSSLGQLREISTQLLAAEALVARYAQEQAAVQALERDQAA